MFIQQRRLPLNRITLAMAATMLSGATSAWADDPNAVEPSAAVQLEQTEVVATAEKQARQALGSSVITAEDIARRPPVNDVSELIRREPGVNLTGNSSSGARGNSRQIDIRGMGPENTLILIDGRPVTSRNSTRYGWGGDRDTRGDTNWVPADMIERIDVLRGPAAARYGSGAMGGVINIITRQPDNQLHGSLTAFANRPQSPAEGDSNRADFSLSGPMTDNLHFRVYGSANKTDADALGINDSHQVANDQLSAGREGVRNRDLNGLLRWNLDERQSLELEAGYSRQGNIFAGDTQWNGGGDFVESLYGQETNVLQRSNYALTHSGFWDWGDSKASVAYDYTRNWRVGEGLAGRPEGAPEEGAGAFTSRLKNLRVSGEVNLPLNIGAEQTLTLGAEWLRETLTDPGALRDQGGMWGYDPPSGAVPGFSRGNEEVRAYSYALYAEDNIQVTDRLTLTPGLRFDSHHTFGDNWSPSLNAAYRLTEQWTLKGGIARAYKAPNLYQANPNYLLYSRGNGCWQRQSSCYLVGDDSLKPETSINKEIGLAFDSGSWRATATYFNNDYRNKIESGTESLGTVGATDIYRWTNIDKAQVSGVEGSLFVPLAERVEWSTNFTYMIESKDKDNGQPLSIIPKYTINSTLDWDVTDRLSLQASGTWYGKQEPPSLYRATGASLDGRSLSPYAVFGIGAGYRVSDNLSLRAGVNNLFDKRLYREGNSEDAGAATYNEPGRALYVSATTSF